MAEIDSLIFKTKKPKSSKKSRAKRLSQEIFTDTKNVINEVNHSLERSSIQWSFSKATRFVRVKQQLGPAFANIKSNLWKSRATSFGIGKRSSPLNITGKDSPPPNAYKLPSSFDKVGMATKFSPARSHARRMSTPGPGAYELRQKIGDSPSFSFKSRTFVKSRAQTPPPGSYNPNFTLVSNGRYTNIGFGKRTPTRETGSDTPGPGTYDLVQITSYDKNSTISSKPKSAKRALSLDLSSIIKST